MWVVSSVAPENILLSSAPLLWFSNSSLTSPADKGHVSSEQQVPLFTLHSLGTLQALRELLRFYYKGGKSKNYFASGVGGQITSKKKKKKSPNGPTR